MGMNMMMNVFLNKKTIFIGPKFVGLSNHGTKFKHF